ncbi:MAG: hypothetical protein PF689_05460 [Deltaproteobacteria bacterium]|jgi:hypothetical protein|nr:hypothetical protein [Deltaproteobacteria bacterium]
MKNTKNKKYKTPTLKSEELFSEHALGACTEYTDSCDRFPPGQQSAN